MKMPKKLKNQGTEADKLQFPKFAVEERKIYLFSYKI